MHDEFLPVATIYELRLRWLLPSSAAVLIGTLIFNSQKLLLRLPGPAIMTMAFLLFLAIACHTASFLTDRVSARLKVAYPTVVLWCYPTVSMGVITAGAWAFLGISNKLLGRGFWSDWLGLTGQDTTSFFFACFAAMLLFIALQFAFSMIKVLNWILEVPRNHLQSISSQISPENGNIKAELGAAFDKIRHESEQIKEKRLKATRLNRFALYGMLIMLSCFAAWVTFFRPALILYYRAEIQLRTFLEPESAWETFRHLSEKYPTYRFLDSVHYRMAWIQDRRLNRHAEAAVSYEKFLSRYGKANVWADEAIASLVRLNLDKLNRPDLALFWVEEYLGSFPGGVMALHMHLYKIRALNKTGRTSEAQLELENARRLYSDKKIQIINSEDRLIDLASFADALDAEKALTGNPN